MGDVKDKYESPFDTTLVEQLARRLTQNATVEFPVSAVKSGFGGEQSFPPSIDKQGIPEDLFPASISTAKPGGE